jgi:hypothetical protein
VGNFRGKQSPTYSLLGALSSSKNHNSDEGNSERRRASEGWGASVLPCQLSQLQSGILSVACILIENPPNIMGIVAPRVDLNKEISVGNKIKYVDTDMVRSEVYNCGSKRPIRWGK